MIPSIGRIVHYIDKYQKTPEFIPSAAIITGLNQILSPTAPVSLNVDLKVFYRIGEADLRDVPFSEKYQPGHWSWPPVQDPTKL